MAKQQFERIVSFATTPEQDDALQRLAENCLTTKSVTLRQMLALYLRANQATNGHAQEQV